MNNIEKAQKNRTLRQLWMAPVFVAILGFGWFMPLLGFFIPLCMVLGIGVAAWRGRKWCDWFCPRGSFYDAVMVKLSPQKKIPVLLKSMPFRVAALVILMGVMAVNLMLRWPSINSIGLFFVTMLTVTTLLGVVLAVLYHPRSWCSFCPIGTVIHWMSAVKYPLTLCSELCVSCGACKKACPIQLDPSKYKSAGAQLVREPDCVKCNLCIAACPKQSLARCNE
jgi:ferredoxin-type protein NapH